MSETENMMRKAQHKMVLVVVMAIVFAMVCQAYEKKTYRDSNGRIIGVATTDNMGRTTYRDSNGRLIGTAKNDGTFPLFAFMGMHTTTHPVMHQCQQVVTEIGAK